MATSPPTPDLNGNDLHGRLDGFGARALVHATGDIVYEHDYEHDHISWGGTFTELLGYSPDEMGDTGESWLGRVHPDDVVAARAEIDAAIVQGRAADLEYRFRARGGGYRWFRDRGVLELDSAGRLKRVVGVMRDVTARRLTQRELDSFFDLSLDLLCVATVGGYFTRVNPAFSRVLGYSAAELISRPYIDFVHPDDRGRTAVEAGNLAAGQPVLKFDNRYVCRDGKVRWLSWNAVYNPDDGLIYAVARDMTDQKEVERHERLMARELDHRVKNTLAGVMAALEQSRSGAGSIESFSEKLSGRVRAMATAHELLARTHWKGASLRRAAADILTPFGAGSGRVRLDGPDVTLSTRSAPVICMTLHELATNAAKHGALSVPEGAVRLSWTVDQAGSRPRLRLVWEERGGPTAAPPSTRGYGTDFIEHGVPYELGGTVALSFPGPGVRCEIVCPLSAGAVQAAGGGA